MNKFILKIMHDNKTVISTTHARQICVPIKKYDIVRNISCNPVLQPLAICDKHKITVYTDNPPDVSCLHVGWQYKIESIITFKTTNAIKHEYVADSVKKYGDVVVYRPIFNAYLVAYSVDDKWIMEFEEV